MELYHACHHYQYTFLKTKALFYCPRRSVCQGAAGAIPRPPGMGGSRAGGGEREDGNQMGNWGEGELKTAMQSHDPEKAQGQKS